MMGQMGEMMGGDHWDGGNHDWENDWENEGSDSDGSSSEDDGREKMNKMANMLAKEDDGLEMWTDVLHRMFNKKVKMEVRRQMKRKGCAGGDDSDDSDGSNDGYDSDGSNDWDREGEWDEQPGLEDFNYYWDQAESYGPSKGISTQQFIDEWR